jgi:hypothetical protein
MARRLVLKNVPVEGPAGGESDFDYAEMMILILRGGTAQGQGLNLDQVIRALDAIEPIETAMATQANEVILSDTQWATLKEKLDAFQFGFAHRVIAQFGLMIRNAPEMGTEKAAAD